MPKHARSTRDAILDEAFKLIYEGGYHAVSVDRILDAAGTTKGAFYHHFPSKLALAGAIVEERIGSNLRPWRDSMRETDDPVGALHDWLAHPPDGSWIYGCPLNNLALEMSAVDEGLRATIEATFGVWREAIAIGLRRGKEEGRIRGDVDPEAAASFMLGSYEGAVALAKNARDEATLRTILGQLEAYLSSLET